MQKTISDLPQDADKETVKRYARTYIMMLLSTQLFGDKSSTCMHIRWLSYVARLEDMGRYSWGSATLSWLYWCLCHVANRNVVVRLSANIEREGADSRVVEAQDIFTPAKGCRSFRDPGAPTYGTIEGCDGIDLLCSDRVALGLSQAYLEWWHELGRRFFKLAIESGDGLMMRLMPWRVWVKVVDEVGVVVEREGGKELVVEDDVLGEAGITAEVVEMTVEIIALETRMRVELEVVEVEMIVMVVEVV
ncbi:hypothetical protein Ahy_B10g105102 [Arachis hypogaea]|uniref:Aminotransferase-like plant mobile domain-containing protein n=1 Tax=Arachis hypogaea TaxID=3818 RepID=A0A444X7B4_ARAHY|nr:hypothetical protein Ahy_B10g105102 [Arachis hypogaea]